MAVQFFTSLDEKAFKEFLSESIEEIITAKFQPIIKTDEPQKMFLSRHETAKTLGISLPTLHDYTKQGKIVAFRIGVKVRYKAEDIEKALIKIKGGSNG